MFPSVLLLVKEYPTHYLRSSYLKVYYQTLACTSQFPPPFFWKAKQK